MTGALLPQRTLILLVAAIGLAATMLGPLLSAHPDHARAVWSIWPVLVMGGIAVDRLIRLDPILENSSWLGWWSAGLIFYVVHLYFGFGVVYRGDVTAVLEGQGWLTAGSNAALLLFWSLSVLAALLPREPPGEVWLHRIASLLFAATALPASVVFADHPGSRLAGLALVAFWLLALWRRFFRPGS